MFRILDRYVIREVVPPFVLSLLVLTFVLEIPPILVQGEPLIEKGVAWSVIGRILATLLPQALGITIPMALLLGLLIGLGRLSADREFVALQACGVSIFRLLRPVALLATAATAATAYVMIVALPDANQAFREITFNIVASSAEGDVKPRVFFEGLGPNRALYVRDVVSNGGWRDAFLADTSGNETTAYFATQGRLLIDRNRKSVDLILENGTRHTTYLNRPDDYVGDSFAQQIIRVDAESVFPRTTILKGDNEKTIAELHATIAEAEKVMATATTQDVRDAMRRNAYAAEFTIQQKFVIPGACIVLALIGLALGVTNSKDGKLGGFVVGFIVIMVYYVLLWTSRALAISGTLRPDFAGWIANVVFGVIGVALVLWRAGSADQPIRFILPRLRAAPPAPQTQDAAMLANVVGDLISAPAETPTSSRRRVVKVVVKVPQFTLPRPRLLDLYVTRQYANVFLLGVFGLLGLFYISTFIDMADKLFRGSATTGMLLRYLYFETPRYIYYIIPISALIATLVVIGLLTKNSELIVMRACGVSLYRSAVPLLLVAVGLSGVLYVLQERVLADWNRHADAIRHVMRGLPAQTFGVLDRRWIVGTEGDIYHYENFDPVRNLFGRLTRFDLDPQTWQLLSLTYASDVVLTSAPPATAAEDDRAFEWQGRRGWTRTFTRVSTGKTPRTLVSYKQFATLKMPLEPPAYFKTDEPEAEWMTYDQLRNYIEKLRVSGISGVNVVPYIVQLQRKVAFPFVTLIMTLLAVPFAVTTGRRGAMYGVGVGIVLAIVYWTTLSVIGAIGAGGLISPTLAAWAPNILFGAAAGYMILTVRT